MFEALTSTSPAHDGNGSASSTGNTGNTSPILFISRIYHSTRSACAVSCAGAAGCLLCHGCACAIGPVPSRPRPAGNPVEARQMRLRTADMPCPRAVENRKALGQILFNEHPSQLGLRAKQIL